MWRESLRRGNRPEAKSNSELFNWAAPGSHYWNDPNARRIESIMLDNGTRTHTLGCSASRHSLAGCRRIRHTCLMRWLINIWLNSVCRMASLQNTYSLGSFSRGSFTRFVCVHDSILVNSQGNTPERLGIFYVPCSGEAGVATFKNTHTHSFTAVSIPEEQSWLLY